MTITQPSLNGHAVSNGNGHSNGHSNGSDPSADQYGSNESPPASNGNGNGHSEHAHVHSSDGFTTRSIHVGSRPDPHTGAVVPGLHVATTYKQYGVGKHHVSTIRRIARMVARTIEIQLTPQGFEYSRSDNPTRAALEQTLASLDTQGGPYGQGPAGEALVFASGSAATAAIAYWASLQRKEGGGGGRDGVSGGGGHILAVNDCVSI